MAIIVDSGINLTQEIRGKPRIKAPYMQLSSCPIENRGTYSSSLISKAEEPQENARSNNMLDHTETTEELLLGMGHEGSSQCLSEDESFLKIASVGRDLSTYEESGAVYDNTSTGEDSCTYGDLVDLNGNLDFDMLSLEDDAEESAESQTESVASESWSMIDLPTAESNCKESEGDQMRRVDDAVEKLSWSLEVCIDDEDEKEIRWRSCQCCFPES